MLYTRLVLVAVLMLSTLTLVGDTAWGQAANCQPANLLIILDRSSSMWFTSHASCINSDCFTPTNQTCKKVAPDCDYLPYTYQPSPGTQTRYSRECRSTTGGKRCYFVRWDIAQNAVKEIAYRYGGSAAQSYANRKLRFGLEIFSTEAEILAGIVSDPPAIDTALQSASVGGATDFQKAFQKAHEHLQTVVNADTLKNRPTHILFITDGSPNEGCAPSEAIVKDLASGTGTYQLKDNQGNIYKVKTYAMGFGRGLSAKAHECLTKIAVAGGTQRCDPANTGCQAYYFADDNTTTQSAIKAIADNATAEICDGKDNDCDGTTDEGNPGGGASCSTGQTGACATGQMNCVSGTLQCQPQAGSQPETCDGKDNNCDGQIDNGLSGPNCANQKGVCSGAKQTCDGANGWKACDAAAYTAHSGDYEASETKCDGKDNDCDGQIDNGLSGPNCANQEGVCNGAKQTCDGANGWKACDAAAHTAHSGDYEASETKCDGKDNDCDGNIDESLSAPACTKQAGVCSGAKQTCDGSNGWKDCDAAAYTAHSGDYEASETKCDGKDNDCDGSVDEGNPGGGGACNTGKQGICAAGTRVCAGGSYTCQQSAQPGAEVCDGKDNDCDGSVDEGNPGGGASCDTGKLGECKTGTQTCNSGTLSCRQSTQPTTESCDGKDNDCDGSVDEGNPGGGGTCDTGKLGECKAGTRQCTNGTLACEQSAQTVAESCNGKDDDCDGATDEGNPGGGGTCDTGKQGTCAQGNLRCNAGSLRCEQTVQPALEGCDGKDNDCDGSVDEGIQRGCYGGPSGTEGKGECKGGTQTCTAGSWGTCSGAVTPQTEACDGKDNDCDGTIDEGCACRQGQTQPCGTDQGTCTKGTQTCDAQGTWGACTGGIQPTTERCDDKDNDCDGTIDEDFTDKGKACTAGQGECKASGQLRCDPGGTKLTCDAKAGTPSAEACDGKDNDCDGQIDENLSKVCTTACGQGVELCQGGKYEACNAPQPGVEICDDKDNDCDGKVDNDLQKPCQTACGKGVEACVKGKWLSCSAPPATDEVCDGKDNDCDGTVDEDIAARPCQGACGSGQAQCESGVFVGCSAQQPQPEACDGVDNDCDGTIDNIDPRICRSACGEGKETCKDGRWEGCSAPQPQEESCDGQDNNCDGFVDNKAPCPTGEGCHQGACALTCQKDEDCGANKECRDGFCAEDPCKSVKCDEGKRCISGLCVDACAVVTCPQGEVCRQGTCIENTCYGLGCPGGQVCKGGACVTDACLAASCQPTQACRDGACVDSCAGVRCADKERCEDGTCVPNACAGVKCEEGRRCVEGTCVVDPCSNLTCKEGRRCDPKQKRCVDDPCLTLHCPEGQRCQEGQCHASATAEQPSTEQASTEPATGQDDDEAPTDGRIAGRGDAGIIQDDDPPKSPGGCACQGTAPGTSLPWLLLLLLLIARLRHASPYMPT